MSVFYRWIDSVKVLRRARHKIGHFGDVLLIQSLGLVQKKTKPNTTNANNTGTKWQKYTKCKQQSKENLHLNQASSRISRVDTHFPQKLPFDLYLTFILIHFNVYRRSQ